MNLKYPFKIIPKPYYKKFNISDLSKDAIFYICRRSNSDEDPYDKFGLLRVSAFISSKKELPGLSMNFLGHFKENYIKYRSLKYAIYEWKEGSFVNYFKVYNNIEENTGAKPISFKLSSMHEQVFPYARSDKDYNKKIPDNLKTSHIPHIILTVEHKPNNSNFWHVQLEIKDTLQHEGKAININISSKYGEGIYNYFILHFLSTSRMIKNINPAMVPRKYYSKLL